jgi:hypothetical protein
VGGDGWWIWEVGSWFVVENSNGGWREKLGGEEPRRAPGYITDRDVLWCFEMQNLRI